MDWDDEYDNGHDDMSHTSHGNNSMSDTGSSEGGLNFKDIANPVSRYFFLSDNAQDEITGSDKREMKCLSCGHMFTGEMYDSCPECFSSDTEEVIDQNDGPW